MEVRFRVFGSQNPGFGSTYESLEFFKISICRHFILFIFCCNCYIMIANQQPWTTLSMTMLLLLINLACCEAVSLAIYLSFESYLNHLSFQSKFLLLRRHCYSGLTTMKYVDERLAMNSSNSIWLLDWSMRARAIQRSLFHHHSEVYSFELKLSEASSSFLW